ncbi:methyltransferase [Gryllotalpicola sp.]|uniref:class I SAM-dependent methyltransferase n=1 Tax=Gryllotalpicola sp. TaxID=1932787 RepID=UPI002626A681|nr:methyltransferase [Gryllotalpicola sp.]
MSIGDHYFSASPESNPKFRPLSVTLAGRDLELTTASGIFSPDRVDSGTAVLLSSVPAPPPGGNLLDLGCGWGPIALTLALGSPHATVWAVDVNERALELVRRNADAAGATNIRALTPEQVPADIEFTAIWSNPPIRVGKDELHRLLAAWLPRLEPESDGWLVVGKNLGADSLARWLEGALGDEFHITKPDSAKGFRVLRVRRR